VQGGLGRLHDVDVALELVRAIDPLEACISELQRARVVALAELAPLLALAALDIWLAARR
jgi:hypothetical protein